jgi:alpha-dioxygenase
LEVAALLSLRELVSRQLSLRDLEPTDDDGHEWHDKIDLAALDLYRDRERGILKFNDLRRDLYMKPFKTYHELTGESCSESPQAAALRDVYGEGGIENIDLMVGNLAEAKIPGSAVSETPLVIFLLVASRCLEADPFLNESYTEKYYKAEGLAWIENETDGIRDALRRHRPRTGQAHPRKPIRLQALCGMANIDHVRKHLASFGGSQRINVT